MFLPLRRPAQLQAVPVRIARSVEGRSLLQVLSYVHSSVLPRVSVPSLPTATPLLMCPRKRNSMIARSRRGGSDEAAPHVSVASDWGGPARARAGAAQNARPAPAAD